MFMPPLPGPKPIRAHYAIRREYEEAMDRYRFQMRAFEAHGWVFGGGLLSVPFAIAAAIMVSGDPVWKTPIWVPLLTGFVVIAGFMGLGQLAYLKFGHGSKERID